MVAGILVARPEKAGALQRGPSYSTALGASADFDQRGVTVASPMSRAASVIRS